MTPSRFADFPNDILILISRNGNVFLYLQMDRISLGNKSFTIQTATKLRGNTDTRCPPLCVKRKYLNNFHNTISIQLHSRDRSHIAVCLQMGFYTHFHHLGFHCYPIKSLSWERGYVKITLNPGWTLKKVGGVGGWVGVWKGIGGIPPSPNPFISKKSLTPSPSPPSLSEVSCNIETTPRSSCLPEWKEGCAKNLI